MPLYGTMYGMATKKTTIYLPEELKGDLEKVARSREVSEADVIRQALEEFIERATRPPLKFPLFHSDDGGLSWRDEELLAEGFGED